MRRWLVETEGQPELGSAERSALAHLVFHTLVREARPEPWADDPEDTGVELAWEPSFRPAPSYRFVEIELAEVGWSFEWCVPEEDAERSATWDEDDLYAPGPATLEIDEHRAVLETEEGKLSIRSGAVEVEYWEDADGADPDILIHVVQGLTGWVACDPVEATLEFEPVRCGACGREDESQRCWDRRCPHCDSSQLTRARDEPTEPELHVPDDEAARRLLDALIGTNALCVHARTERLLLTLRAALASTEAALALGEALLGLSEVDELFLEERELSAIIHAW